MFKGLGNLMSNKGSRPDHQHGPQINKNDAGAWMGGCGGRGGRGGGATGFSSKGDLICSSIGVKGLGRGRGTRHLLSALGCWFSHDPMSS